MTVGGFGTIRKPGATGHSASGIDTHNSPRALAAKVDLRRCVLAAIGPEHAHILDLFAGRGVLHDAVWHKAASYTGCDLDWFRDHRRMFACDNLVLLRAIDLAPFTVFDIDAFGSPWEQMTILAARRRVAPGERVAVVVTCGEGLKLKCGALPHALSLLCGLPPLLPHANRGHGPMIDAALRECARRMGARITQHWRAGSLAGTAMQYHAVVMTGSEACA